MSQLHVPKGSMVSRYETSRCRYCQETIKVGDVIRNGDKGWGHHKCVVKDERANKAQAKLDANADEANSRRWKTG